MQLWRTVKDEEVYLRDYTSPREARQGLGAYYLLYNEARPHQALGYQTPAETCFAPVPGPRCAPEAPCMARGIA
jgi:putative transposase